MLTCQLISVDSLRSNKPKTKVLPSSRLWLFPSVPVTYDLLKRSLGKSNPRLRFQQQNLRDGWTEQRGEIYGGEVRGRLRVGL